MRKSFLVSLIVFFVLAISSPLLAVTRSQSAKADGAAELAQLKKALGLSQKQCDSIEAIMKKVTEDLRKNAESKASSKAKADKQQAIGMGAQQEFVAVLTPAQRKKLTDMMQAQVQSRARAEANMRSAATATKAKPGPQPTTQPGPRMSYIEVVRTKLSRVGLSKAQKAKTDLIISDFEKKHAALKKDQKLAPDKKKTKAAILKGGAMTKIKAVLTPEQRKKLSQKI